jgi:hypothetical protein
MLGEASRRESLRCSGTSRPLRKILFAFRQSFKQLYSKRRATIQPDTFTNVTNDTVICLEVHKIYNNLNIGRNCLLVKQRLHQIRAYEISEHTDEQLATMWKMHGHVMHLA